MNIQQMMQQAQQMQKRMADVQAKLGGIEVSGQSGGGMVQVTMTCKGEMRKIAIQPDLINPADKETLEDLIVAAVNAARSKADETLASETQAMMQEFGLPPGFELPKF
jgi:DNA-binding YbaB/EbfC family protein